MALLLFALVCSVLWVWLFVHLAGVRGRNPAVWGIVGFFTGIIGLAVLLALPNLAKEAADAEARAAAAAEQERRHRETLAAISAGRVPAAEVARKPGATG